MISRFLKPTKHIEQFSEAKDTRKPTGRPRVRIVLPASVIRRNERRVEAKKRGPLAEQLQSAIEAFEESKTLAVNAHKMKRLAFLRCYQLASAVQTDDDWALFVELYHERMATLLRPRDRKRVLFFTVLSAMGDDTEPARKEASRLVNNVDSYWKRNAPAEELRLQLLKKGFSGIKQTSKRAIQLNDSIPHFPATHIVPIQARLIGEAVKLLSFERGVKLHFAGTITGTGKSLHMDIDEVRSSGPTTDQ